MSTFPLLPTPFERTGRSVEPTFAFDQERAHRVEDTLHGYSDRFLSSIAITAAGKQELFDHVSYGTPQASLAARAIYDYWVNELGSRGKIRYEASLAYDFKRIDESAQQYKDRLAHTGKGETLLREMEAGSIDTEYWKRGKIGVNVPEIATMASVVNVEAMLGRAAYTLDRVVYSQSGSPEQFESIQEMETVHMPLHDILGQSASEMMQRSEVNKARLVAAGLRHVVDDAAHEIAEVNRVSGQEVVLASLFGKMPEQAIFEAPQDSHYGEQIHYSVYDLADMTNGRWEGRLFARTKTVGGLADKKANNPDYREASPQDIIGLKIVVPDTTQLAECMEFVIRRVHSCDELTPVVASSKKQSVFAQGHPEYLCQLEQHMSPEVFSGVQLKELSGPVEKGFQVIKMTCNGERDGVLLRSEIQGMTYADRSRERHDAPHFLAPKGNSWLPGMPPHIPGSGETLRGILSRKVALTMGDASSITPVVTSSGVQYSKEVLRYIHGYEE